uniref:Putative secreted protein n=1 Tax=Anopheles darlingi TaxID=43151 RepID=A0A2M4D3L6_ANODA
MMVVLMIMMIIVVVQILVGCNWVALIMVAASGRRACIAIVAVSFILIRWMRPHNSTQMEANLKDILYTSGFYQLQPGAEAKALRFNRVDG